MRKILLVVAIAFCSYNLNAQLFQSFTAEDGYPFAEEQAEQIFTNVKLQAIGTITASLDNGIAVQFNIDNGESDTWVYSFINEDDPSQSTSVVVIRVPILGYRNLTNEVGDALEDFEAFIPEDPLSTDSWINSDVMASSIRGSDDYSYMIGLYPDASASLVGLGVNEINPDLPVGETYWNVNFGSLDDINNVKFICVVHAENENTVCYEINTGSVRELSGMNDFMMYPVPATEILNIKIPQELQGKNFLVNVFSIDGQFVNAFENSSEKFSIKTSELNPGVYILRFVYQNEVYQTTFLVQ